MASTVIDLKTLPADLTGKVALITGASRGIGRATALKLASLGASIAVNYASNADAANEVVNLIKALGTGAKAVALQADVGNPQDAHRLVSETVAHLGRLDILINNAGVFLGGPLTSFSEADYKKTIDTNIHGTYYVTQAAVKVIQDHGAIVNTSSIVTKTPLEFPTSAYILSKGAVEAFTRAIAMELAPRRIRVNTVSPGFTLSDMSRSGGDALLEAGVKSCPLGRLGSPEDIAESIAFLVVPRTGAWITGQNIMSSGGIGFAL
eukprot:jgi/Hompol1/3799/HPOL_006787-RA